MPISLTQINSYKNLLKMELIKIGKGKISSSPKWCSQEKGFFPGRRLSGRSEQEGNIREKSTQPGHRFLEHTGRGGAHAQVRVPLKCLPKAIT